MLVKRHKFLLGSNLTFWFSQLLFPIHTKTYRAETSLEKFRVTGKLRLEGISGDDLAPLSASSAGLKRRQEQENS